MPLPLRIRQLRYLRKCRQGHNFEIVKGTWLRVIANITQAWIDLKIVKIRET